MTRTSPKVKLATAMASALVLSACASGYNTASQAVPSGAADATVQLAEIKDNLDAAAGRPLTAMPQSAASAKDGAPVVAFNSDVAPPIKGIGYAQVSGQPGKTLNEKRLMALRAARLEAMRDLTEQVHGLRLTSETLIRDAVTRNDVIRGIVEGEIRGARTVRITPKDSDTFEIELALDRDTIGYIVRAARGGL